MTSSVIAAVLLVSTLVMAVLALVQHRDGRLTGSRMAIVLGGATSSLVAAGGLVLV